MERPWVLFLLRHLIKCRDELEHYASYLVNLLVKNDMVSLPVSTKGGIENG